MPSTELLVLGLGNVLCADDGLGVVAVERLLARYEPPEGVRILDGGTLGLSLLAYTCDARAILLLDAIRGDGPPGTPVRLEGEEVAPAVRDRLSVHQIGVADLLDSMRLIDRYPRRMMLLGLVPESLELRVGLSPSVARGLAGLVQSAVQLCEELGHGLIPRAAGASRLPGRDGAWREAATAS